MNIGKAAAATGITPKMIRHYEAIGLLPVSQRTDAGYRVFSEKDLHVLRFIRRARDLGFSLEQMRTLLSLWQDRTRASADVKRLADTQVAVLDARIRELTEMRDLLAGLAASCHGDDRADCPIIRDLESASADDIRAPCPAIPSSTTTR